MVTDTLDFNSSLPDFSLTGVDTKIHSPQYYADKKLIIIIFSCNHCPYVKAYEDRIIALQNDYRDKGVQVVAINSNDAEKYPEDSFGEMKKRAKEKGFNFPYLHDETQAVARAFGATHTPEIFLFDEERKLKYYGKIDDNWQEPDRVRTRYLKEAIEDLLNGREVAVPQTYAIGCTIKWKY
jgi:peroxiredoxin